MGKKCINVHKLLGATSISGVAPFLLRINEVYLTAVTKRPYCKVQPDGTVAVPFNQ